MRLRIGPEGIRGWESETGEKQRFTLGESEDGSQSGGFAPSGRRGEWFQGWTASNRTSSNRQAESGERDSLRTLGGYVWWRQQRNWESVKKSKGGVLKFCNGANCELEWQKGGCRDARVIIYRAIKETNKHQKLTAWLKVIYQRKTEQTVDWVKGRYRWLWRISRPQGGTRPWRLI